MIDFAGGIPIHQKLNKTKFLCDLNNKVNLSAKSSVRTVVWDGWSLVQTLHISCKWTHKESGYTFVSQYFSGKVQYMNSSWQELTFCSSTSCRCNKIPQITRVIHKALKCSSAAYCVSGTHERSMPYL